MNASEVGSKDWWLVIRSMPPIEAMTHLNDYRAALLAENIGKSSYVQTAPVITRINAELKRLNMLMDNLRWSKACYEVLPPELFEKVNEYRIAQERAQQQD